MTVQKKNKENSRPDLTHYLKELPFYGTLKTNIYYNVCYNISYNICSKLKNQNLNA